MWNVLIFCLSLPFPFVASLNAHRVGDAYCLPRATADIPCTSADSVVANPSDCVKIPQLISLLAKSPVFHILSESYYLHMWILMDIDGRPPAQESPIARLTCLLERWINAPNGEKSVKNLCDLFCEAGLNEFSRIIRERASENTTEVIWNPEDILPSTDNPLTDSTENLTTCNIRSARRSHILCTENRRCATKDVIILILSMALVISILGNLVTVFPYLKFEHNMPSPPSLSGVLLDHQNYSDMIYWPEAAGLLLKGGKGEQLYLGSYYSDEYISDSIRIDNHTYYTPGYARRNQLSSSAGFFQGFHLRPFALDNKTAVKVANLIPGLYSWINFSSVFAWNWADWENVTVGDSLTTSLPYYFCRARCNTTAFDVNSFGVVPGTTVPSSGSCYVSSGCGIEKTTEYEILALNALGRLITRRPSPNALPVPTSDTFDNPEWDLYQPTNFPEVARSLVVAGFLRNYTSREHQWLYIARVHQETFYNGQQVNYTSLGYLDPLRNIVHYVDSVDTTESKNAYIIYVPEYSPMGTGGRGWVNTVVKILRKLPPLVSTDEAVQLRDITDGYRARFNSVNPTFYMTSTVSDEPQARIVEDDDRNVEIFGYPLGVLSWVSSLSVDIEWSPSLQYGTDGLGKSFYICRLEYDENDDLPTERRTHLLPGMAGRDGCVAAVGNGSGVIKDGRYEVLVYNQLHNYRLPVFSGSLEK